MRHLSAAFITRWTFWAFLAFAAWVTLSSPAARATLGEREDSVEKDRMAFSAQDRATTAHALYAIHEISNGGVAIREYAVSNGVIFAIAWNGLQHPDLGPLLGSYFAEFQDALRASPRQPGHRFYGSVRGPHLVVEKFGHMRALQGKAYAPALIPEGVSLDEIR